MIRVLTLLFVVLFVMVLVKFGRSGERGFGLRPEGQGRE